MGLNLLILMLNYIMSYTVTVPAGVLWYLDRLAEYLDLPGDRVERRRLSFSSGMEFAGRVVENLMGQRTRLGHYNPREQRFYNRRIFPFDVKEEKKTDQQVKILMTMLSKGLPPQYFLEPDYGFGLDVHGEATLKRHLEYLKQGTPRLTSEDFAQFSIELALISSMLVSVYLASN